MRRLICLLSGAGMLWLAACGSVPVASHAEEVARAAPPATFFVSSTPTVAPTRTLSSPTVTAGYRLPRLTAAPPASSTPEQCYATGGTIISISVPSPKLNYPIDTRIYLPPCYAVSRQRYPVLYLIHGLNFTNDQWERLGAPLAADSLIAAGEIAPLIIVMPSDRKDERLAAAFTADLVPYIDSHYRTLANRHARALGGLSRGAGWAVRIGLEHPELFGRLGAHSPAVFVGDENNLIQRARYLPADQLPEIYIDIGEKDSLLHCAVWLHQVLAWFKIPHTYILRPGAHSEQYWSANVENYLRFYASGWRALQP